MVAITTTVALGCASAAPRLPSVAPTAPNTDAILRLVGRFNSAHACPISETLALTSAHATDHRPFDPSVKAFPLIWSDANGHEGILKPLTVFSARDLSVMEIIPPATRWYPLAAAAPTVGERLLTLGYDFRSRKAMYGPRTFDVAVLRIVARNVIFSPSILPGASGACVLNSRGEVVAINAWQARAEDQGDVGVAVGVWGETFGPQ